MWRGAWARWRAMAPSDAYASHKPLVESNTDLNPAAYFLTNFTLYETQAVWIDSTTPAQFCELCQFFESIFPVQYSCTEDWLKCLLICRVTAFVCKPSWSSWAICTLWLSTLSIDTLTSTLQIFLRLVVLLDLLLLKYYLFTEDWLKCLLFFGVTSFLFKIPVLCRSFRAICTLRLSAFTSTLQIL